MIKLPLETIIQKIREKTGMTQEEVRDKIKQRSYRDWKKRQLSKFSLRISKITKEEKKSIYETTPTWSSTRLMKSLEKSKKECLQEKASTNSVKRRMLNCLEILCKFLI